MTETNILAIDSEKMCISRVIYDVVGLNGRNINWSVFTTSAPPVAPRPHNGGGGGEDTLSLR